MLGLGVQETATGNDVPLGGGIRQIQIKGFVPQVKVRAVGDKDVILKACIPANREPRRFVKGAVT